jgi:hypothetical protein
LVKPVDHNFRDTFILKQLADGRKKVFHTGGIDRFATHGTCLLRDVTDGFVLVFILFALSQEVKLNNEGLSKHKTPDAG